jgi:hypothetical protein
MERFKKEVEAIVKHKLVDELHMFHHDDAADMLDRLLKLEAVAMKHMENTLRSCGCSICMLLKKEIAK